MCYSSVSMVIVTWGLAYTSIRIFFLWGLEYMIFFFFCTHHTHTHTISQEANEHKMEEENALPEA